MITFLTADLVNTCVISEINSVQALVLNGAYVNVISNTWDFFAVTSQNALRKFFFSFIVKGSDSG